MGACDADEGASVKKAAAAARRAEEAAFGVTLATDETVLAEGSRVVALCCFVGVISSLDRQAMSVAIVPMSKGRNAEKSGL